MGAGVRRGARPSKEPGGAATNFAVRQEDLGEGAGQWFRQVAATVHDRGVDCEILAEPLPIGKGGVLAGCALRRVVEDWISSDSAVRQGACVRGLVCPRRLCCPRRLKSCCLGLPFGSGSGVQRLEASAGLCARLR
ncbi:hypothetical protein L3X38_038071 [Prunus dulcis]|uniref:Uncharacterized protein n=1 Tax=Prunus dulcis TaxID=3755 RepID=A0AAD4V4Y0_PRUDU|nr:hypothetical protein L3X38_038071 [Prunus dulcis]